MLSILLGPVLLQQRTVAQQEPPIIDLHLHAENGWDMGGLANLFDRLGVARAGNGPGGPDTLALSFARRLSGRFIPFAALGELAFHLQNEGTAAWSLQSQGILQYLSRLEGELASGQYKGIGEVFPNNLHTHGSWLAFRFPADSPLMRRLWAYSAKYRVPISVHLEADLTSVAEMERLLDITPQGTFIWAHTGFFADPPLLARLFQQHPDLSAELSWRDERSGNLRQQISIGGQLKPDWKDLLEQFPDRFVIGTDVSGQSLAEYEAVINYWRGVLPQLSPATAEKIAHQNAEHLLNLPSVVR